MKREPVFVPKCSAAPRRWSWRIRSIGQLMIVIAVIGLVLAALPRKSRPPAPLALRLTPVPGKLAFSQVPVPDVSAQPRTPRDPFVRIAPAEIDPGMVVRADPDLDAAMVFNPDAGRPESWPADRVPGVAPVEPTLRLWTLPPPVVPQAQPR
jgi:hypothetical protein